jgi:hypothetical protein
MKRDFDGLDSGAREVLQAFRLLAGQLLKPPTGIPRIENSEEPTNPAAAE